MKLHPIVWMKKLSAVLVGVMKPLGIWGLAGLAFLDSGLFPLPTTMDGTVLLYVQGDHRKFILYCLVAAVASAIGALIPYYVGRAGGELFLLKRINRQRYEAIRDRFERQEFLAMMIPAMLPPPTPIKLFEFAAGVFEMKPLNFALAIFTGKFIQFLICSILMILFGPAIFGWFKTMSHEHAGLLWGIGGLFLLVIAVWVARKLFRRRGGAKFPVEEDAA